MYPVQYVPDEFVGNQYAETQIFTFYYKVKKINDGAVELELTAPIAPKLTMEQVE